MACGDKVHIQSGKRISKQTLVWIPANDAWYAHKTLVKSSNKFIELKFKA